MKKIMFDDHFGLTNAVMEGRKTMTRRMVPGKLVKAIEDGAPGYAVMESKYKVGEVVAVAQSYNNFRWPAPQRSDFSEILKSAGWDNKMFVKAELMPHRIRITNVRVEKLQNISDEDCLREGVRKLESAGNPTMFTFDGWKFKNKVNRCADSPKEAFAALIDKISGNGTWEKNPWVLVYSFELLK